MIYEIPTNIKPNIKLYKVYVLCSFFLIFPNTKKFNILCMINIQACFGALSPLPEILININNFIINYISIFIIRKTFLYFNGKPLEMFSGYIFI